MTKSQKIHLNAYIKYYFLNSTKYTKKKNICAIIIYVCGNNWDPVCIYLPQIKSKRNVLYVRRIVITFQLYVSIYLCVYKVGRTVVKRFALS